MEAYCTCGSHLPDEASFCMHCGRPRDGFSDDPPQVESPAAGDEDLEAPAKSKPRFQDLLWSTAIPALSASLLRFVLGVVDPTLGLLSLLLIGSAGYYSVRIYESRSAMRLPTSLGCGVGAVTGMTCGLVSMAVQTAVLAASGGVDAFVERIHREVDTMPWASQLSDQLADPSFMAMALVAMLFVEVLVLVAVATAGGLIASRVGRARAV